MLHKSILPIILLLTLCSCVVSFGMNGNNEKDVENKGNISNSIPGDINTTNTYPENVPTTSVNGFYWEKFNENHKTICALYYYIFRVLSFCNLIATRTSPKNKYSYIIPYSLIRGIFSTKPFSSKYDFIGCNWYLGIGNVQYVGGFLTLAFVCKPTKYLPPFLQNKVTIHIFDFKPFYFLITYFLQKEYRRADDYFSPGVVGFAISKVNKTDKFNMDYKAALILHHSLYLGLFVVQVKITEYYDISVNLFGWLLGKLVYKLLETRNKFIKHKKKI